MSDPFEDVLNLEDQFYQEGYQQGVKDGAKAGKMEGRALGLEKGFEKFMESGRLYGRSLVWASRLPQGTQATKPEFAESERQKNPQPETSPRQLPLLSENPRLKKNIVALYALLEPETLATENSDEAVNDFDDRVKRAQGKTRIIERMSGEQVLRVAETESSFDSASNVSRPTLEV